jgi:CRISPR-associated exonuclease Cas4
VLGLAVLLVLAGAMLVWSARRQRRESGVPLGRVIYDDTGAWQECPRPLFSARYLLAGKPDYIVERDAHLIPVEVKPRRTAARPYASDILQLAAYCLLIEENHDRIPPYGILKYRSRTFPIEYTPQLRRRLLSAMDSMRRDLHEEVVRPSHGSIRRCRACGHWDHCQARLEEGDGGFSTEGSPWP